MSLVFLNAQLQAKILALCLQPVIQRMAGLPTPQLEQVISASANTIKCAVVRSAAFTDFMLNLS